MSAASRIPAAALAAAALVFAGCRGAPTGTLRYGDERPLIRFTTTGLRFDGKPVTPAEAVRLLEERQIPKDATLHLLVDPDYKDDRAMWVFQHNYLGKAGYRRTVQVHERRSDSDSAWERDRKKKEDARRKDG